MGPGVWTSLSDIGLSAGVPGPSRPADRSQAANLGLDHGGLIAEPSTPVSSRTLSSSRGTRIGSGGARTAGEVIFSHWDIMATLNRYAELWFDV